MSQFVECFAQNEDGTQPLHHVWTMSEQTD